jgi:hypothetical protein
MAVGDYRAPDIKRALTYIGPHGNVSHKTGVVTIPAAALIGETLDFMILPRGAQILDCILNLLDTTNGSLTLALGIAQIPGKASTQVDPDALIVATAAATAVLIRRNKTTIAKTALLLDDDYLIQAIIAGANNAAEAVCEVTVFYENVGTP